jgi:hypothetical protein
MYDIPFDRSFLQLSNGIRYVMSSTDTKPELTAKASMAQPVSQPAVYANGLTRTDIILDPDFYSCCQYFETQLRDILRDLTFPISFYAK